MRQHRFDDEVVLGKLVAEIRRAGKVPTFAELRIRRLDDPSVPAEKTFKRLGSREALLQQVIAYCRAHEEWADVLAIVEPLVVSDEQDTGSDRDTDVEVVGVVYLLKAGRHYKIGRSKSAGRREYELAIQLPERARLVHQIATDDPSGIEAYWHRRFADRRKNGEWFELTADDVRAFRRRRFM